MEERAFGAAGMRLVLEEGLCGEELSFFALLDGSGKAEGAIPFATARDWKRAGAGDTGPNTGGMASLSPAPRDGRGAGGRDDGPLHPPPSLSSLPGAGRPTAAFFTLA